MRTVLIDGDILVVSTGASLEKEICWDADENGIGDEWTLHCDTAEVKKTIMQAVENIRDDLKADKAVITLSKGTTFRHELSDDYKAGRGRKPVGTAEVKRWLIEEQGAKYIPGIEADDIMGILATNPRIIKGEKVICSADKDMKTIPGLLYRDGELTEISPFEAEQYWMMQTLAGDTTDGYPGCPGLGEKSAMEALEDLKGWEQYEHVYKSGKKEGQIEMKWRSTKEATMWDVVVSQFIKAGKTVEDAILQARLARILHSDDYDFKNKKVKLWQPK